MIYVKAPKWDQVRTGLSLATMIMGHHIKQALYSAAQIYGTVGNVLRRKSMGRIMVIEERYEVQEMVISKAKVTQSKANGDQDTKVRFSKRNKGLQLPFHHEKHSTASPPIPTPQKRNYSETAL